MEVAWRMHGTRRRMATDAYCCRKVSIGLTFEAHRAGTPPASRDSRAVLGPRSRCDRRPTGESSSPTVRTSRPREHIGGFWILECADMDEAVVWARKGGPLNNGAVIAKVT